MTQQYTPVTWQDETTSQQGTLINAERLNQMQQAHHFADGFEEVDAVPTADPSVAYHKMVYCTADSTFYRWDGTEWTKDIDDETKALLQQEIARATAAEGGLAQDIADEATARETADTAMQEAIDTLGDAIEAEETAREQADTALGNRITAEAAARESADTALGNRITAEATARADADTALGGRIDTEQARAEAAEQANAQAIANTYTKAEIDTALGAKADQATTYTKSEVQTYVSNALDGYLPMVRTTGNQTIGGVKTLSAPGGLVLRTTSSFNSIVYGSTTNYNSFTVRNYVAGDPSKYDEDYRIEIPYVSATENNLAFRVFAPRNTKGDTNEAQSRISHGYYVKNNDTGYIQNAFQKRDGTAAPNIVARFDGTQWYNTANTRGYNAGSAYTDDVATIGTLDAYTPMVRTTGNQTIVGTKTFNQSIRGKTVCNYYRNADSKNGYVKVYSWTDDTESMLIEIMGNSSNDVGYYTELLVTAISTTKGWVTFLKSAYQNTTQRIEAILTNDGTNFELWVKFVSHRYANISIKRNGRYGTEADLGTITVVGTNYDTKPDAGDYSLYVDVVDATS